MATSRPASDHRARLAVAWLIPLALGAAVSFAPQVLNDGDTFWHVAAGRWMIAHASVPATDPFSFTFLGRPWMAHEWLSEVAMGAAWTAAGWAGVMLLTGLAAGALAAVMANWLLRWLAPLSATMALALGLACVAPGLLARPHMLVLPALALWTVGLLKARREGRAPSPWLALLLALWANLHSSFIVGLLVAAAFALEAALDVKAWRPRALAGWAAFLALSAVATLATPHGLAGLAFPLKVLNMKTLAVITEWQGPDFMKLSPLEIALIGALFVSFWKGVRLTAVRAALLVGLTHMTFQHVRQEVLLGVVGPLILAEPLGRALGRGEAAAWRAPWSEALVAGALCAALVVARLASPQVRADGPTAPVTALAQVPAALKTQPVLNDYDFGGYLIFEGVRPYIDGRADMYGDAFVADDDAIQRGTQGLIDAAIKRYDIRWAILRPDRPLVGALEHMPGWREIYRDKVAVVVAKSG
ncbi:MAG TPA: hypothetical protein VGG29_19315 [Caulobacteraceae bacterium]|jgi:hypothetical protein